MPRPLEEVIPLTSLHTLSLRPVLGTAVGLVTAAVLTAPGALAAETTTPAPSPSGTSSAAPSGSGTSAAAQGFRYWGFFQLENGAWTFANSGPYQIVPKEGSVDGWRFQASGSSDARAPRNTPSFDAICGKYAGEAGKKRVGVVIDYGRTADAKDGANPPAPMARCAIIATGASSAEALNAIAGPREEGGMVCAIDNWPGSTGCSEPLATLSAEAKAADDKVDISVSAPREQPKAQDAGAPQQQATQGPSKKVLTGIAVAVVALAGGAAALFRRRKAKAADPTTSPGSAAPSGTGATTADDVDVRP